MFDFEGISIRILVFTLSQTFEANAVRRCVVSGWKQCCDGTSLVCGAETYRLVQGGKKDSYACSLYTVMRSYHVLSFLI